MSDKKGFSLKSLFVEETPEAQQVAPIASTISAASSVPQNSSDFEVKASEKLIAALEANQSSDFDYYKFSKALTGLITIPDEAIRFKSVFSMASVMGVKKDSLISSADKYKKILESELLNFNQTFVDPFKERISSDEKAMNEKEAEIMSLTEQIEILKKKKNLFQLRYLQISLILKRKKRILKR